MLKCSNPHFGRRCTHFGFIIMIFFSIILRRFHNTSEALIIKRDDKNVSEGENATLSCILTDTNEELMQVIWYRRTIMRQSVEHIYTIFQKSHFANDDVNGLKERLTFTGNVAEGIASLYLTNVTLFDDGVYTCTFILDHSGPVSSTIKLDVKVGPVFHASVVTHPVGRDEVILAVCTAVARPVAQLLWDFGGKSILRVETNSTKHLNGTSTINSYLMGAPSKQMNHKEVCCVVQHPTLRNPQNVSCRLNVEYPPLAKVIPLQTGNKADHVYQCEADANPKPIGYNWTRCIPRWWT
ncbi:poliovirus receptor-like isoform X2 [Denticeps clupeoides]|uniref:poliovirus receptor-like isoform X2 n=1 Tax=Denticeps clupeoides TaxID=299321 RepID=UPI0010A480C9|nr:poliovirus receptor-like isoform X2 [Denticeps clupeoides]XP_028847128.1 poliovirus receptor-like isoform X2 [Denticeps clupeoides]